eukprot:m.44554 g.44554  ORF g.44554 m.44554 type:complete len:69 (+) comp13024_c0_seq2:595-801(+)
MPILWLNSKHEPIVSVCHHTMKTSRDWMRDQAKPPHSYPSNAKGKPALKILTSVMGRSFPSVSTKPNR